MDEDITKIQEPHRYKDEISKTIQNDTMMLPSAIDAFKNCGFMTIDYLGAFLTKVFSNSAIMCLQGALFCGTSVH